MTPWAPPSARRTAVARPTPRDEPVMIAHFPSKRLLGSGMATGASGICVHQLCPNLALIQIIFFRLFKAAPRLTRRKHAANSFPLQFDRSFSDKKKSILEGFVMKMNFVIAAAALLVFFALSQDTNAQGRSGRSINQREHNQRVRIRNGIRSGELTARETGRL